MNLKRCVSKTPKASHPKILLLCCLFSMILFYLPNHSYAQGEIVVQVEDLHTKQKLSNDQVVPGDYNFSQAISKRGNNSTISQRNNTNALSRNSYSPITNNFRNSNPSASWWQLFVRWYRSFKF